MSRNRTRFLKEFPKAISDENAAVFIGAGVSVGAGYPSWKELLREIGDELGVKSDDVYDLAALAQWSVSDTGGATRIRQVIRDQIAVDHDIPAPLNILARMPIRHLWTTNYDRLIERALSAIRRPCSVISAQSDLALKVTAGAARVYKMHGTVDQLDDIVISTDDYELFRSRRGAFLPLLQAHLSSFSMLFLGLSFTDPNLRHVLSLIRESFTDAPPAHFAIVRPPQKGDFRSAEEFEARLAQHNLWAKDLQRYGLFAIEIEDYNEVPDLLAEVERRVARNRVWISGSWPLDEATTPEVSFVHDVAEKVGEVVGSSGLTLVSGSGLLVGSGSMSGFLSSLQKTGAWDLERRLIVRPFPQPIDGGEPARAQWDLLRAELARLAGLVVFIGGLKAKAGALVDSSGVHAERAIAQAKGAYLLPIGATGGAAATIAAELTGSDLPFDGPDALRPSDEQLASLADASVGAAELANRVLKILKSRML